MLLGAVRGSLEYCNDLEFPSLFARLEDYQILKFVRKKAFDEDILAPDGIKVCEESDPCLNGGTCITIRSGSGYKCDCPKILDGIFQGIPTHVGTDCETPLIISTPAETQKLSVCEESDPCQNGGKCEVIQNSPGYKCDCPKFLEGINQGNPSYLGLNCETPITISTTAVNQTLSGTLIDSQCLTTSDSDSPDKNATCKFPWKFDGILRQECITDKDPNNKHWCSTKINENLEHIEGYGYWGLCSPNSCPPLNSRVCDLTTGKCGQCKPGFFGEFCTKCNCNLQGTKINICKSDSGKCECKDGHSGIHCDIDFPKPRPEYGTCGLNNAQRGEKVLGGTKTKRGELPFMVALGYYDKRGNVNYRCGGALINRRYVLTAAQCQHKEKASQQIAEVVLGGEWGLRFPNDWNFKKSQQFNITKDDVISHESFNLDQANKGNDIALIRLPREAITSNEKLDKTVLPACLDWDQAYQNPANIYIVAGWGRTSNDLYNRGDELLSGAHSSRLRQVEVPYIPLDQCLSDWYGHNVTPEGIICAGGTKGKGSCLGDSGGPLVAKRNGIYFLEGISSFGISRCGLEFPSVYTSIKYFIPWIKENIQYFENKNSN